MGKLIIYAIIGLATAAGVIALGIWIKIAILKYIASIFGEELSKKFDYDYLARRTAEEIIRRQMIIEKNKQKREEEETEIEV